MPRLRRFSAALLLASALVVVAAAAAEAQIVPGCDAEHQFSASGFASRICDVPDFDQRRNEGTLQGDGRTRPVMGLAGNGGCHCVPTAFTNLLGFYAQKGVDVLPGKFPWLTRSGYAAQPNAAPANYLAGAPYPDAEIAAYNEVTDLVRMLGLKVKTGDAGCGTGWGTVIDHHNWLTLFGLFPHARFNIVGYGVDGTTPRTMGTVHAFGGTIALAYGRYTDYMENGTTATATKRSGGHAISLEGVSGQTTTAQFKIRDPAGDEQDRYRQSPFALTDVSAVRRTLTVDGKTSTRWRWGPQAEPGKSQRLLDSWIALFPTLLVTTNGTDLGLHPGVKLNNEDRPALVKLPFKFKKKIVAAAVLPATGEIAVALQGSKVLRAVGVHDRKLRRIGRTRGRIRDVVADPTGRRIFALSGRRIVHWDAHGAIRDELDLPRPADALAYDTSPVALAGERLVAVGRADRLATTIHPAEMKVVDVQHLPRSALRGSGRLDLAFDHRGKLLVRRGRSGALRRTSSRRSERTRTRSLRGAGGKATGFAVSDVGSILTVRDGKVIELVPDGTKVLRDSPFAGLRVKGQVLAITRTGGEPGAHDPNFTIDERIPYDPEFAEMAKEVPPPPAPQPQPEPQPEPPPQPQPQPDLLIDAVDERSATVRNAGDGPAGRFEIHLTGRDPAPQVFRVEGLAPGASTTITFDCQRLSERTLTVDATGAVAERDETNNTRSFTSDCV